MTVLYRRELLWFTGASQRRGAFGRRNANNRTRIELELHTSGRERYLVVGYDRRGPHNDLHTKIVSSIQRNRDISVRGKGQARRERTWTAGGGGAGAAAGQSPAQSKKARLQRFVALYTEADELRSFNYGHVLTVASFILAGAGAYYGMRRELQGVDQRAARQDERLDRDRTAD